MLIISHFLLVRLLDFGHPKSVLKSGWLRRRAHCCCKAADRTQAMSVCAPLLSSPLRPLKAQKSRRAASLANLLCTRGLPSIFSYAVRMARVECQRADGLWSAALLKRTVVCISFQHSFIRSVNRKGEMPEQAVAGQQHCSRALLSPVTLSIRSYAV